MIHIVKYANRKLYDKGQRAYINLSDVHNHVKEGRSVFVFDNTTKSEVTEEVLLQVALKFCSLNKEQLVNLINQKA